MRATSKRLLLGLLVLMSAAAASAQTVDEIVEKSIAAEGGRPALAKVKNRSSAGRINMSTPGGDISGTIEVFNEAPNKSRSLVKIDLSAMGAGTVVVDERFDGTSGYSMDSMQGDSAITGSRLDALKNSVFPSVFLDYKERGTKLTLVGKEKVGDRDAIALSFVPATGPATKVWIDAATYLALKSAITVDHPQLGTVEQTFEFSDYREVDGIKVAFMLKGMTGPQPFTVVLDKVEHNVKIDPALFAKPAGK